MTLTGYDAAYPPATPPQTDVVCIYGGGNTPHVWTGVEIARQKARYRLPIWVRSNPSRASATWDAGAFMAWLRVNGCPKGVATVLDLETAIAPAYVNAFGAQLHANGWLVLPYGSSSTLFRNPALDGYFVALPGAQAIPSNCAAVQYGQGGGGAWDLDWFADDIPMWDTRPAPPLPPVPAPVPGPIYPEDTMQPFTVTVQIVNGDGWCSIPGGKSAAQVINVVPIDLDPALVGHYTNIPRWAGVTSDNKLVFGTDGTTDPTGDFGFIVWCAA